MDEFVRATFAGGLRDMNGCQRAREIERMSESKPARVPLAARAKGTRRVSFPMLRVRDAAQASDRKSGGHGGHRSPYDSSRSTGPGTTTRLTNELVQHRSERSDCRSCWREVYRVLRADGTSILFSVEVTATLISSSRASGPASLPTARAN